MADVITSGTSHPSLKPFDDLFHKFMTERNTPGAGVAVVKSGRLVMARGYGWADKDEQRPAGPTSLFRIASVSKPITAVAVLQLVEQKKLELDARVCGVLGLKPTDPRLAQITILQLLRHTAGFDRGESFDPMFRPVTIAEEQGVDPPAGPWPIIRYMMKRPLDFDPGERYAYSNFGYCLLGRVIEEITGKTCDQYVKDAVLAPLGVHDMRIGATLRAQRAEGEATYYAGQGRPKAVVGEIGQRVPKPYGAFYLEAMDSHGAWIASAVSLARFAAAFDHPKTCPILGEAMIKQMFARPPGPAGYEPNGKPKAAYYGCGWSVRPVRTKANHWHMGMLAGTSTLLVRRHDGLNWVVLFNAHQGLEGKRLAGEIDSLMHRAADAVKEWPKYDLFRHYSTD